MSVRLQNSASKTTEGQIHAKENEGMWGKKLMERAEGHNLAIIRKHLPIPMWEQVMWSEKGLLWHSLY